MTYHNDNARTGQNTAETALTPNLNHIGFGKLFTQVVDGYVYAQPLYLPQVTIPGRGTHNVVYVATQHDSLYAFDGDSKSGSNASPLWKVSFTNPAANVTSVPNADTTCTDIVPEIGITGTPAIDAAGGTLYVVAKTKENGSFVQRLHALNVSTGAEKLGGPVVIAASVPGNGLGSVGGTLSFDPLKQNQRPGLLLQSGIVYIGWASHCDNGPYHGWVIAYDAQTLKQVGVFNTTPNTTPNGTNGTKGGLWQAGAAPAADSAGNVYFSTGNGTFDTSVADFGDSLLSLALVGGTLSLKDYFTPFNQGALNLFDLDLGSGGVLVLPDQVGSQQHPHLLVQAGKEGKIYLIDRDHMGGFNAIDDSQIVQSLPSAVGAMWSMPAYWNNTLYFQGSSLFSGGGDVLKAFAINNGLLSTRPVAVGSTLIQFPGATPSVSANGSTNGIVWLLQTDHIAVNGHAILRAFDASNLFELYNSEQNSHRDNPGLAVKFTVPTVVNGKVYVGAQNQLSVYGLLQ